MTLKTLAATAVLGMVAFVPAALAAGDPLTAARADLTKLQSDFSAAHDTRWRTAEQQMLRRFRTGRAQVHQAVRAARTAIQAARRAGAPITNTEAAKVSDAAVVPATNP